MSHIYPENPERNGLRFDWSSGEDEEGVWSEVFSLDADGNYADCVAIFRARPTDLYDEHCGRRAEEYCAALNADPNAPAPPDAR